MPRTFLLIATFLSGALVAVAAVHPAFTGTWKLDTAKSDFGPFPGPSQVTDRVVQTDAEFTINRNRQGEDSVIHVPVDGSQTDNSLRGSAMQTQGNWDGETLVIHYSGQRRGQPTKVEERWTVAPDGKSMKVTRHLSGGPGATDQTLIMVRADAADHK